jgi:hypothetical protein
LAVDGVILFYAEYMMAGGFYDGLCRHFQCSFPYGAFTQFVDSYFTFCLFSNWNIDVPKIKRTRREGRYFCRKHVHQLDFDFMPRMPFEETFEVAKVAEVVLKD